MTVLVLADAPRPVAGLVLDGRVPPAVVQHDVVGRGEVEPGAAGLQRQHEGAGAGALLELGDQAVAGAAGQAAVVAGDRQAGDLAEVLGQAAAPRGEVGEDEHPLAGGEDRLDDLLEAGQLARAPGQRPAVVAVGGGVVADLLQRGDGGEDRRPCGVRRRRRRPTLSDQLVEHGLVEPDLLGGHRAVVELVDLVGQLGGDLGLALRAAEHEDPVERPQRAPRRRPSSWAMNAGRGPTQAGVGEVEDRPQVAEAVLDRRAGQRQPRAGRDAGAAAGPSRWPGS